MSASASASAPPPLEYAVVQGDEDFDASMSEEEKNIIGTGKVPIHREGRFRSPFAHPRFGGPTKVKVGLVLDNVFEYDIQKGAFEAAFFLSLTGDKELPDMSLTYSNGKEVETTTIVDSPTFKFLRVRGAFQSPVDLRKYPFDTQELAIEIEDQKAGVDQLLFVPDQNRTALDEGFSVAGWDIASMGAKAYRHLYPPRFDRDDLYVSRYKFSLGLERFGVSAALSVFVPAIVIVLISLTGMWVPPDELEVRSNTGAPMLAAAVLFHYSLIQSLPATGYLTRADKMMMAVYVCLLFNMISTWFFVVVNERHVELAFKIARAVVPPLSVGVMVASAIL
ncbi:MAG: hypothetical protein U0165_19240 [Polyangiaceae bacterium]